MRRSAGLLYLLGAGAACGYVWSSVPRDAVAGPAWQISVAGMTTLALVLGVMLQAAVQDGRRAPRAVGGSLLFVGGFVFPLAVASAIFSHSLTADRVASAPAPDKPPVGSAALASPFAPASLAYNADEGD